MTHFVEEAIPSGDRILMSEDGRIVTQGDPADMLRHIAPVYDNVLMSLTLLPYWSSRTAWLGCVLPELISTFILL